MIDQNEAWKHRSLEEVLRLCAEAKRHPQEAPSRIARFLHVVLSRRPPNGNPSTPVLASWELTAACNLRCPHCYQKAGADACSSASLDTRQALQLVEQLAKLGIIQLTLTGGEPLLRHDLPEILLAIKSARMAVILQTNATMVDPPMADRLHSVLDPRLAMVQVSLDGATAATHERIRGAGTFQAACDGIRQLAGKGLSVIVSCCPVRWNEEELPALYSLAGALGASAFQATPLAPFAPSDDSLTPDQDAVLRAEAEICLRAQVPGAPRYLGGVSGEDLHWISHASARRLLPRCSVVPDRFVCGGLRTKIHIAADGGVFPCVFAVANELSLGRVTESSLEQIWESRAAHPFVIGRLAEASVCGKCAWAAICRGGCPGLALVRYGSLERPDPRCRYACELEPTCQPVQREESP